MNAERDMAETRDTGAGEQPARVHRIPYAFCFAAAFLVLLALVSYDDRDSALLAGGMGTPDPISNWMGYLGARVAHLLLLGVGFGAFAGVLLLLLTFGRRMVGGPGIRPARWDYWLALLMFMMGAAMYLGSWPDLLGDFAQDFNIVLTTGGVLGQRLCDPERGWMQVILNPTGNSIVALLVIVVALVILWLFDWHGLFFSRPGTEEDGEATAALEVTAADEAAAEEQSEYSRRLAARRHRVGERPKPAAAEREPEAAPAALAVDAPAPPAARTAAATGPDTVTASGVYELPAPVLLKKRDDRETSAKEDEVEHKKALIQKTLDSFQIDARVGDATSGPRVTLFEVLPSPGVKVERISNIGNNLAMELCAEQLRILTPIPGRNTVGIEVPNATAATVSLRGLMETKAWRDSTAQIPVLLGRNINGSVVVLDLAKAPHLLIAGATGSGKSVCMNALIVSLLYRFTPADLRLILVDPKVVEFHGYASLPHLVTPVISEVKKVPLALRYAIKEMERRYRVLAKVGVRNIESFNNRKPSPEPVLDDDGKPIPPRLPYIVIIVDELADIMMTAKQDVETSLARIAQLARAVGIHAVVATQRPSVNVITGVIKANFPTRIAFQVTSHIDSRTILDGKGAEALLGRGDMLFRPPGAARLERLQSAYVEDDEIEKVVAFVAGQAPQAFDPDVFKVPVAPGEGGGAPGEEGAAAEGMDEDVIQKAIEIIRRDRRATISYIQRRLGIGYNRAAQVMEILEQRGVVGPQVGTSPREILVDVEGDDMAPTEPQDDGGRESPA